MTTDADRATNAISPSPGSPDSPATALGEPPSPQYSDPDSYDVLSVEQVQTALGRSRASVYRYANTQPDEINPPFDPKRLNPELRKHKEDPLAFHPSEVERFARDVLGIKQITIAVQVNEHAENRRLLYQILDELKEIRSLLKVDSSSNST